jgi:hypothetical protein
MHKPQQPAGSSPLGEKESTPFEGGYLTDGETLFHIERTIFEGRRGELLVELEDCATLELIVCSARSVTELGLRPVQPLTQNAA